MTFADLLYKGFAWLYNNKQTLSGSALAALTVLQLSPELKDLIDPVTYKWTMLSVSVLVVLFARSGSGGIVSKVIPHSIPTSLSAKEST